MAIRCSRVLCAVLAAAVLSIASVAPAFADPGSPGLARPTTAVYEDADERPVIGDELGNSQGGGGGGDVGGVEATSAGGDASLPFTGFAAALVLGTGLAALLVGFALHGGARRLRQT